MFIRQRQKTDKLYTDKNTTQGGHSPGKPGIVREFKSGQGKIREKRKSQGKCVLACGHLPRILFLTQNVQGVLY